MTVTPIPAPRAAGRVLPGPLPAVPVDDCRLDGPCAVCATLTPSARAALADELVTEAVAR